MIFNVTDKQGGGKCVYYTTETLSVANWDATNKKYELSIDKMPLDSVVLVQPEKGSESVWGSCSIEVPENLKENKKLVFTCSQVPTSDVIVNIAVWDKTEHEESGSITKCTVIPNVFEINQIKNINYINGKYWVVGYNGLVAHSDDLVNWNKMTVGTSNWGYISYGNGIYLLLGIMDDFAISNNGIDWDTPAPTITPFHSADFLQFIDGKFVVCAYSEYKSIYTTLDGIDWDNDLDVNNVHNLKKINDKYYAIPFNSTNLYVLSNLNTIEKEITLPTAIWDMDYINGVYVFVDSVGKLQYTEDFINFIDADVDVGFSARCTFAFGGGYILCTQYDGSLSKPVKYFLYTEDGKKWNQTKFDVEDSLFVGTSFNNDMFYTIGSKGNIYYINLGKTINTIYTIPPSNDKCVYNTTEILSKTSWDTDTNKLELTLDNVKEKSFIILKPKRGFETDFNDCNIDIPENYKQDGKLVFTCSKIPTKDIQVDISIWNNNEYKEDAEPIIDVSQDTIPTFTAGNHHTHIVKFNDFYLILDDINVGTVNTILYTKDLKNFETVNLPIQIKDNGVSMFVSQGHIVILFQEHTGSGTSADPYVFSQKELISTDGKNWTYNTYNNISYQYVNTKSCMDGDDYYVLINNNIDGKSYVVKYNYTDKFTLYDVSAYVTNWVLRRIIKFKNKFYIFVAQIGDEDYVLVTADFVTYNKVVLSTEATIVYGYPYIYDDKLVVGSVRDYADIKYTIDGDTWLSTPNTSGVVAQDNVHKINNTYIAFTHNTGSGNPTANLYKLPTFDTLESIGQFTFTEYPNGGITCSIVDDDKIICILYGATSIGYIQVKQDKVELNYVMKSGGSGVTDLSQDFIDNTYNETNLTNKVVKIVDNGVYVNGNIHCELKTPINDYKNEEQKLCELPVDNDYGYDESVLIEAKYPDGDLTNMTEKTKYYDPSGSAYINPATFENKVMKVKSYVPIENASDNDVVITPENLTLNLVLTDNNYQGNKYVAHFRYKGLHYVAMCDANTTSSIKTYYYYSSKDGKVWSKTPYTFNTDGSTGFVKNFVVYNDYVFCGKFYTNDLVTWKKYSIFDSYISVYTFETNGKIITVAVGSSNINSIYLFLPETNSWKLVTTVTSSVSVSNHNFMYCNGKYFALFGNTIMYSENFTDWVTISKDFGYTDKTFIFYYKNKYVTVGNVPGSGYSLVKMYTSENLVDWVEIELPLLNSPSGTLIDVVVLNDVMYVCAGSNQRIYYTKNLTSYEYVTIDTQTHWAITHIKYTNGLFYCIGNYQYYSDPYHSITKIYLLNFNQNNILISRTQEELTIKNGETKTFLIPYKEKTSDTTLKFTNTYIDLGNLENKTLQYTSGTDTAPTTGYYHKTDTDVWYKNGTEIIVTIIDTLPTPSQENFGAYYLVDDTLSTMVHKTINDGNIYWYLKPVTFTFDKDYLYKAYLADNGIGVDSNGVVGEYIVEQDKDSIALFAYDDAGDCIHGIKGTVTFVKKNLSGVTQKILCSIVDNVVKLPPFSVLKSFRIKGAL